MVLIDPDHQRAMEVFISPFTVSGLSRYLPAFHKDIIPSGKYSIHTKRTHHAKKYLLLHCLTAFPFPVNKGVVQVAQVLVYGPSS